MLVSSFNLSQSFNYTPYLFCKKQFKSEINCFCIWTQLINLRAKDRVRIQKQLISVLNGFLGVHANMDPLI